MQLAPIVLFAYNRPWHVKQTLQSLSNNELAADSDLFIYADGPKLNATVEQLEKIKNVRTVIREKKWCKTVTIIESDNNKGLAESVIEGVTKTVNEAEKVIVLEDDMITSRYYLKFMNDALNTYELNNDVMCISGYIYPVKGKLPETYFIRGADCWGWATWKRSWNDFEKDGKKLLDDIERKGLSAEFDFKGTYKYTQMLREQVQGKNSSWAIRWYASAFLKNRYCLYPGISLVQNIGIDGSGTHSGTSTKWNVVIASEPIKVKPIPVTENVAAKKQIISYFNESTKNESFIKKVVRKIYRKIFQKPIKHGWFGDYKTWAEAGGKSSGYDGAHILEKVKKAVLKVKNGEAPYERDSVLFDEIQFSQPLLDAFKNIVTENEGILHVIDFGGSLGSSYFQNQGFLSYTKELKWSVIEQKHFVDCGKQFIEDEQLKFYYTIEEALKHLKPQVLLLSSVIQYFEKPYELIQKCMSYGFDYIIIDRTAFIESNSERITVQVVPEFIYNASYPAWFFNEQKFVNAFSLRYKLVNEFESKFDPREQLDDKVWSYRKGFVFKKL